MQPPYDEKVATLLLDWRGYLQHTRKTSDHTVTVYGRNVEDFLATLADVKKKRLTPDDLTALTVKEGREWLTAMHMRGVAGRSANVGLSGLRNFYRFLQKQGYAENEAVFALSFARKEKLLPKPAVHSDVMALLRQWKEIYPSDSQHILMRDKMLFMLLFGTGMRISEALNLNCGDLVPGKDNVIVKGKGNKERVVPLTSFVGAHLHAYKEIRAGKAEEPLFIGAFGGRLHPDLARRRLRVARRTLGLGEHISPHSLRHGFATELMEKGGDIRVIQELLGHANLSTTEIYAKLSDRRMREEYIASHPRAQG